MVEGEVSNLLAAGQGFHWHHPS